jgi:hypothetical protein
MAFTTDDFDKIWASTSPLTPYEFSEANYKDGWNFVGSTPPARQMWDRVQKSNDEKSKWLYDTVNPIGTVLTNSNTEDVELTANTTAEITSLDLSAGVWVVTGHLQYKTVVTRQFASLNDSGSLNAGVEGTAVHFAGSSSNTTLALCVTRIFELSSSTEIRLNGFASVACTAGTSHITAVRIK